jgi:hypothetical protein
MALMRSWPFVMRSLTFSDQSSEMTMIFVTSECDGRITTREFTTQEQADLYITAREQHGASIIGVDTK